MRVRVLLLSILLVALAPSVALAHGGHASPIQTFTQSVGPYELAITVELPTAVPAPLYLVVTPQGEIEQTTIRIQAVPRGFPLEGAAVAEIKTYPGTRVYYSELSADRDGEWELDLQASGPRGDGQARIPFTITIPPIAAETIPLAIALGLMLLLMLSSFSLGALAKQRGRPLPIMADRILGYGIFACLIVEIVLGGQQAARQFSPQPQPASGRPHVNAVLSTNPTQPVAQKPLILTIDLSDGSTGLPVDDIIPHHDALLHLVLIDDTGAAFLHIHPGSIVPGRFRIPVTIERPGSYTAYIEIERQDSGTQIIERRFTVTGSQPAPAIDPPGLGTRTIGDLDIQVTSSLQSIQAGRQTTLTFSVSQAGKPVTDIEPWLGMAGHLIVRSDGGNVYGHVHAVGAMFSPTSSVAVITPPSYGPDIQFVYTFAQPGSYRLWAQFQHNSQIITVPVMLNVAN
ncbi:MAG: hypothetical protein SH847_20290 [Roseiflexaceae bacterium]|nr:hypothetical protein [Roseiflexaceae bacterium]